MKFRFQRLKSEAGQHLSEFLILFLALSVAFVGTQVYLRRGVNAKLKYMEMQLNEAMAPPNTVYLPPPDILLIQLTLNCSKSGDKVDLKAYTIGVYNNKGGSCFDPVWRPEYDCYCCAEGQRTINEWQLCYYYGVCPVNSLRPNEFCEIDYCIEKSDGSGCYAFGIIGTLSIIN